MRNSVVSKTLQYLICRAISAKIGDPNGIRTRVTPVKGECPRPLDDRVREAGLSSIEVFSSSCIAKSSYGADKSGVAIDRFDPFNPPR